uniref:Uncharacterized protein n=1 Tax=Trichogramma kaykai TaxID=54128 RepID=A0ABD2WM40_9HYME
MLPPHARINSAETIFTPSFGATISALVQKEKERAIGPRITSRCILLDTDAHTILSHVLKIHQEQCQRNKIKIETGSGIVLSLLLPMTIAGSRARRSSMRLPGARRKAAKDLIEEHARKCSCIKSWNALLYAFNICFCAYHEQKMISMSNNSFSTV